MTFRLLILLERCTHRGLAYLRVGPLKFNEPALCLRVARRHPGTRTYGKNIYILTGGMSSSTGRLALLTNYSLLGPQ